MALQPGNNLPQARRPAHLPVNQCQDMLFGRQRARQIIRAVLLNSAVQPIPRQMLQHSMNYSILMRHGVRPLPCLEHWRMIENPEESTPCTLSIKIEPDSRGLDPAIHEMARQRPILR